MAGWWLPLLGVGLVCVLMEVGKRYVGKVEGKMW